MLSSDFVGKSSFGGSSAVTPVKYALESQHTSWKVLRDT